MWRSTAAVLFVLSAATLLVATISAQVRVPTDFFVKLVRGTCEGSCPGYSITVDSKGRVAWDGKFFVQQKGPAQKIISREDLESILRKVEETQFFRFQAGRRLCTDSANLLIEVTMNRKVKSVNHDSCSQMKTPEGQKTAELARHIEKVIGAEQWVGKTQTR